jgi:cytochrome b subunit of formate dehydrogenase
LDAVIAVSFVICAITGIYFMIYPNGGSTAQTILFSRYAWDMLHTWSGIIMTIAAILHISLHWKWIVNITGKLIGKQQEKAISKKTTIPTRA